MLPLQLPVTTEDQLAALDELYRTRREARLRTGSQMGLLAVPSSSISRFQPSLLLCENDQAMNRWLKR